MRCSYPEIPYRQSYIRICVRSQNSKSDDVECRRGTRSRQSSKASAYHTLFLFQICSSDSPWHGRKVLLSVTVKIFTKIHKILLKIITN